MSEGERYRDLAERVLGRSANGSEVSLTLDALPPEADGRIRLPDATRILGGVVRRSTGAIVSIAAHVASSLDPNAFGQVVRGLYEADGYRPAPPQPGPMTGFRPSAMRSMAGGVLCRGEDGPWVHTSGHAVDGGSEGVVVWNGPAAGMGPCSPRLHGPQPFPDVLPPLDAPEGVDLLPGGGYGGAGGSWTMGAAAFTTMGARALVDAFATQIAATGASSLGSGGDEVVAWSQWKLATDPWEALLLAFGRGERKELQLRVDREDYRTREDTMRRGMSRVYSGLFRG